MIRLANFVHVTNFRFFAPNMYVIIETITIRPPCRTSHKSYL